MAHKTRSSRKQRHRARLRFRFDNQTLERVGDAAELDRDEVLVLSELDRKLFFDVLAHPPKPAETLKRAFKKSRELIAP